MTGVARKPLMALDDALAVLQAHAGDVAATRALEWVDLLAADGRVLGSDVVSALQVPPHDNTSMDGYALRVADCSADHAMPVSQRVPAGSQPLPLEPGTVARVFTGAPVPPGADAVVMQEDVQLDSDGRARVGLAPREGQWIRRAGEDIRRGDVVLGRGRRLGPAELGLAASIGQARLPVVLRPRVALLSTGDELVMPGTVAPADLRPGAIYNSNRYFLQLMLRRLGCEVTDLGQVPDRRDATVAAFEAAAAQHDLILTSGGVSVGEEDHVRPAVQQLGRLDLWQIAMKPGKPFAWGQVGAACFMGLPGNPVSSFVTFVLLVRPWLLRLQGVQQTGPTVLELTAAFDWPRPDRRREFLRVRRQADGRVTLFPNQSSGVLTSVSWADGLLDNPADGVIQVGQPVRFLPLTDLLA